MSSSRLLQTAFQLGDALALCLFLTGAVALMRDTHAQGQDFEVFWNAGVHLVQGLPLYDQARDGGMVFKYPPWIATFFIPISFLPLEWAKWIWGGTQVLSLVVVVRWLLRRTQSAAWVGISLLSFWGIWAVHALDGQISLVMLATVLAAVDSRRRYVRVLGWVASSAKIFTVVSALALGRAGFRVGVLIRVLATCLVLSAPALIKESPGNLMSSWVHAATSGEAAFGQGKVLGRENQGFPALLRRQIDVPEIPTAIAVILFLSFVWDVLCRVHQKRESERVVGWIAMAAVGHPLAWFHSFVFVFPLCVLALDRSFQGKNWSQRTLALLGTAMVALVSAKTMGNLGASLEMLSIKSVGALFSAAALLLSKADGRVSGSELSSS